MFSAGDVDMLTARGHGVWMNVRGETVHVEPLGLLDHGDKPNCAIHTGDAVNWGIQSTDSESLPGVVGTSMSCIHHWYC